MAPMMRRRLADLDDEDEAFDSTAFDPPRWGIRSAPIRCARSW